MDVGQENGPRSVYLLIQSHKIKLKRINKQVLDLIEVKKSQTIIEQQSIGTAYIPPHKFKANFIDYYEEYVEQNKVDGNRALQNSFTQFKEFIKRDFISPIDITENICKEFRKYLLAKYNGETPKAITQGSSGYSMLQPKTNIIRKIQRRKFQPLPILVIP